MDTLSTLQPQCIQPHVSEQNIEAIERLRYLAERGESGIVYGKSGSGKSELFHQCATELRRNGMAVTEVDLTGSAATELPFVLVRKLGLGLPANSSDREIWLTLHDYAESIRFSNQRFVILFDHLEKLSDQDTSPLDRLLAIFHRSIACLFSSRPKLSRSLRTIFKNRPLIRIELERGSIDDSRQRFLKEISRTDSSLELPEEAISLIQESTNGHTAKLKRLAQLAALAAEAEGLTEIRPELLSAIEKELKH